MYKNNMPTTFYSASSLEQQSRSRHIVLFGSIILSPEFYFLKMLQK
jgi:hypothetical protein